MARPINKLSARFVATASDKGRYADGLGLYLQVGDNANKAWIYRYKADGKERQMGLGPVHTVSLAEARTKAAECRKMLLEGQDPIECQRREKTKLKAEILKVHTFKECAQAVLRAKGAEWNNAKHAKQWPSTLKSYVYPVFGDLAVNDIDTGLVLQVLEPIWNDKPETARRVRGRIETVLDWAKARGWREGENPAAWRGHLDKLLASHSRAQTVKHHGALPYAEIAVFMEALRQHETESAACLEFLILTAARTGEALKMKWDELDLENKLWIVPASRMKAKREHRVPLSAEAIAVLDRMKAVRSSDFVFTGQNTSKPMSNGAMPALLRRMGYNEITVHGFRSTFRDWGAEQTSYPNEVLEMALAHSVGSKVEAAYRRGDLFDKRHRLMKDWAAYCTEPRQNGAVVPIRVARV
ncbi:MAG: tyrosine-type recombinase/integrase [Rhodospirillales bacterium]